MTDIIPLKKWPGGVGEMEAGDRVPKSLLQPHDASEIAGLGNAATRTALGSTGALYSRDSILGTVSQSDGIPTGAIIERGSNANGEYVRYADGTQICWGVSFMTTDTAYGTTGLYYSVYPALTTLPASFVDASYRITAAATSTNILPGGAVPDSGSAFRITGMYSANASVIGVHWMAIGRWY